MSNVLTRKGIAVGSGLALILSGFLGALPASATNAADVTLDPTAGETYNSIRQAGVTLETYLNSREVSSEDSLYYTIESLNGENIYTQLRFAFDDYEDSYVLGTCGALSNWEDDDYTCVYNTSEDFEDGDKILVFAKAGFYSDGLSLDEDSSVLSIWAEDSATNKDLEFKVTAWVDQNSSGTKSVFEPASPTRTVKLFDERNVTASTTVVTTPSGEDATSDVYAKVTFNNDINPYFVSSEDRFWSDDRYYEDEVNGQVRVTRYFNNSPIDDESTYVGSDGVLTAWIRNDAELGNYSARAFFEAGNEGFSFTRWLSPLSSATAVTAGVSELVNGVYGTVADTTTTVILEDGDVGVKSGQKSLAITAQIVDLDGEDYAYRNVDVRAVVSPGSLNSKSEITVTGTTAKTGRNGSDIVGVGKTDANGKFVFNLGNSVAADNDVVYVDLQVKLKNGDWVTGDSFDVYWEDSYLYDFDADVYATSGSNITLNYDVLDQFGGGINTYEDENLVVTVVAYDETEDEDQYDTTALLKTANVPASGKVAISFANFVSVADGFSNVRAFLHKSTDKWNEDYEYALVTAIFRNAATASVDGVENVVSSEVTYGDVSLVGNFTDSATLAAKINGEDGIWGVTEDSEDEVVYISGTVLTVNGAGAAAQAVTVSGPANMHYQFWSSEDYSLDYDNVAANGSITVYTDRDGKFGFYMTSTAVREAGQNITITSGGKSTTVLYKTYHNDNIGEDSKFNVVSWTFPKRPGTFVTDAVVSFTDKWGNPFKGATIEFDSDSDFDEDGGRVFINGTHSYDQPSTKPTNALGQAAFRVQILGSGIQRPGEFYVDDIALDYDVADNNFDFTDSEVSFDNSKTSFAGVFGVQATAKAGAKKGVVNVKTFNTQGRSVKVYVGGKLVQKFSNFKRVNAVKLTGVKAGFRNVSVVVGKRKAVLFQAVNVK
jgi:hypothetical protein